MSASTPTFDTHVTQTHTWLTQELAGLRTGRASPALVENLTIECYGSHSPLQQVASISSPEPQLLVIQPWDPGIVKDIEKSISQSSLGINPVVDGKLIRLPFPPMTQERRDQLTKVVKEKGEQAKVRIRTAREETIKHLRAEQREGNLSEDALELALKQLQQDVDTAIASITAELDSKIVELNAV